MLSHEYGWTTKNILEMTTREVEWRLKKIAARKTQESEFLAALQGVKLKGSGTSTTDMSKEDEKKLDKALKERIVNG